MSLSDILCRGLWSKGRSLISASGLVLGSSAESAHTAYPPHQSALSMSKIKQEINFDLFYFKNLYFFLCQCGSFFSKSKTPIGIICTYFHVIFYESCVKMHQQKKKFLYLNVIQLKWIYNKLHLTSLNCNILPVNTLSVFEIF